MRSSGTSHCSKGHFSDHRYRQTYARSDTASCVFVCSACYNQNIMLPYVPQAGPNRSTTAPVGGVGSSDQARIERNREKTQMENRIRVMKNEVLEKQRTMHDLERDLRALDMALHHVEEDTARIGEEHRRLVNEAKVIGMEAKQSEAGMREKSQDLVRKQDIIDKLAREIAALRTQITEKEHEITIVKQEVGSLMREKENFRRTNELGYFTAKTEDEHAHEKEVRLQLLGQDKKRKENDIAHKQQLLSEVKRYINNKEQDIMQLEAQLRHLTSGG